MKERLGSHTSFSERHRGFKHSARASAGPELSPRDAVLHRVNLGRPDTSKAWGGIVTALARYEPAVDMFAIHQDWDAESVWRSAIGEGPAMLGDVTASHILAIIDLSTLWAQRKVAGPGVHMPNLVVEPTWAHGVRTDVGARYDEEMPGLNVYNWRCGVDSKLHRRYSG